MPYGAKTEPVDEFAFEEDTDGHKGEKYAWMNAAYAMAANINRAFKEYGWCARIRGVQSGGEVEDLPSHTFPTDDGGVDLKCPTEIAITDRREAELAKAGLDPADSSQEHRPGGLHRRAVAVQAEGLPEQPRSDGIEQPVVAPALHVRVLPVRPLPQGHGPRQGRLVLRRRSSLHKWLTNWISEYVDGDPINSTEATKCRRPLAGAAIQYQPRTRKIPDTIRRPSSCGPTSSWKGMDIGLRLVSRLPVAK